MSHAEQTLLIDADDTLWENNVYFEQAIAGFITWLDHRRHTPDEVRDHLNQVERQTIEAHGYGLRSFRRSLLRCFEELHGTEADPYQREAIDSFARLIGDHPIEVLAGVEPTLRTLQTRHRLLLVTKGDEAEQNHKLRLSGLESCFESVEVPAEKHEAAYREIVERHRCDPATTWMIGNSPKSDINPALAAGLNAILIPHASTWVLEHEPVTPPKAGRRLLQLECFSDLTEQL